MRHAEVHVPDAGRIENKAEAAWANLSSIGNVVSETPLPGSLHKLRTASVVVLVNSRTQIRGSPVIGLFHESAVLVRPHSRAIPLQTSMPMSCDILQSLCRAPRAIEGCLRQALDTSMVILDMLLQIRTDGLLYPEPQLGQISVHNLLRGAIVRLVEPEKRSQKSFCCGPAPPHTILALPVWPCMAGARFIRHPLLCC